jgi:hypothetical protein
MEFFPHYVNATPLLGERLFTLYIYPQVFLCQLLPIFIPILLHILITSGDLLRQRKLSTLKYIFHSALSHWFILTTGAHVLQLRNHRSQDRLHLYSDNMVVFVIAYLLCIVTTVVTAIPTPVDGHRSCATIYPSLLQVIKSSQPDKSFDNTAPSHFEGDGTLTVEQDQTNGNHSLITFLLLYQN